MRQGNAVACRALHAALLNGVRQLVREQPAAGAGLRCVSPFREDDVLADGVCVRRHGARRSRRDGIVVNAHGTEVAPETPFHHLTGFGIERARRGCQGLTHRRGHESVVPFGHSHPLMIRGRGLRGADASRCLATGFGRDRRGLVRFHLQHRVPQMGSIPMIDSTLLARLAVASSSFWTCVNL
jgi:hypothetical protein